MRSDSPFRQPDRVKLAVGFVVTAVAALSSHAVLIQGYDIPGPDMSVLTASARLANRALIVLALITVHQLGLQRRGFSFVKRWLLIFMFNAMLSETLRGAFVEGYCTTAWAFAFISNVPNWLSMALSAAIVVGVSPWTSRAWSGVLAAIAIAAFAIFAISPAVSTAFSPINAAIAGLAPQSEWCALPYGWDVLGPAYLTFAEPAVAAFVIAALLWDRLSPKRWLRYVQFTLIVMSLKTQLATPFLYAWLAKVPGWGAFISDGQFALEAFTLALLTGLTWEWSTRKSGRRSAVRPAETTR